VIAREILRSGKALGWARIWLLGRSINSETRQCNSSKNLQPRCPTPFLLSWDSCTSMRFRATAARPWLVWARSLLLSKLDPFLDNIRGDLRFNALMERACNHGKNWKFKFLRNCGAAGEQSDPRLAHNLLPRQTVVSIASNKLYPAETRFVHSGSALNQGSTL
jgi:hypothetical protein